MDKEQLKKKIGQRIVELRSQKGWSQSDTVLCVVIFPFALESNP